METSASEPEQLKRCYKCEEVKPLAEFHKDRTKKGGHSAQCRTCTSVYQKIYNGEHREEKRDYDLRKRYGIDAAQREEMLVEQGGKCAGCHKPDGGSPGERLHVDHSHEHDIIRGVLLCAQCNTAFELGAKTLRRLADLHDRVTAQLEELVSGG